MSRQLSGDRERRWSENNNEISQSFQHRCHEQRATDESRHRKGRPDAKGNGLSHSLEELGHASKWPNFTRKSCPILIMVHMEERVRQEGPETQKLFGRHGADSRQWWQNDQEIGERMQGSHANQKRWGSTKEINSTMFKMTDCFVVTHFISFWEKFFSLELFPLPRRMNRRIWTNSHVDLLSIELDFPQQLAHFKEDGEKNFIS